MSFKQPELPYGIGALAPYLSEEQLTFHYGKHHAAYFAKLNSLVAGTPDEDLTLEEIVLHASGAVFNNAAQAFNHSFYWKCMSPDGGGEPSGNLKAAIERSFHSFEEFQDAFSKTAAGLFGSGWTWLTVDGDGNLEIMALSNADTPRKHGKAPILTLDVWEHAYYVDYRNDRLKYIAGFWGVVDWSFVAEMYAAK
jgi:superoxide dismutase, Fe-Mn family